MASLSLTKVPATPVLSLDKPALPPAAGSRVEIMERGSWIGPFTVTDMPGRTPDHLVLSNGSWVVFEHYADEFNTRPAR